MINNVLLFDIETIADTDGYRRLHAIAPQISDTDVANIMMQARLAEAGTTFLRHHLQRVVAISLLLVTSEKLMLWTLGREAEREKSILTRFFLGIDRFSPMLVSWNGTGFDLPVLHYRALFHGVSAARYFDIGEEDRDFRYNNYLNRYHWRHVDMMDILSGYQARSSAMLDEVAKLCGMPGKLAVDGKQVQDLWFAGKIAEICDYCETDVLNTYGIYLRFELLRGRLSEEEYREKILQLREFLLMQPAAHIQQFCTAWRETTS